MTAATKSNASTSASPDRDGAERPAAGGNRAPAGSPGTLEDLARAQEDLTDELHRLVAQQALDQRPADGDREGTARMVTAARAQLLGQLRDQEQEQARRQLAAATRNSEDAAAGVVRGVTTIIRTVLPAVLLRPEDLIEAAYSLADQGLRVSRTIALTVSSSVRDMAASL
ncbi:MAG TPA: hypothetical protein VGN47_16265 [Blastococcus sp.]|jgi:hypothetical protein|nr:hypothetical protein [Blastococcus sp.]